MFWQEQPVPVAENDAFAGRSILVFLQFQLAQIVVRAAHPRSGSMPPIGYRIVEAAEQHGHRTKKSLEIPSKPKRCG